MDNFEKLKKHNLIGRISEEVQEIRLESTKIKKKVHSCIVRDDEGNIRWACEYSDDGLLHVKYYTSPMFEEYEAIEVEFCPFCGKGTLD